jgi:hypothetical protein
VWQYVTIDRVTARAVPAESAWERRAPCPLCHCLPERSSYGYTVPIGLERHLAGTYGVPRCPVMLTAWELVKERCLAAEHAEWAARRSPSARGAD